MSIARNPHNFGPGSRQHSQTRSGLISLIFDYVISYLLNLVKDVSLLDFFLDISRNQAKGSTGVKSLDNGKNVTGGLLNHENEITSAHDQLFITRYQLTVIDELLRPSQSGILRSRDASREFIMSRTKENWNWWMESNISQEFFSLVIMTLKTDEISSWNAHLQLQSLNWQGKEVQTMVQCPRCWNNKCMQ